MGGSVGVRVDESAGVVIVGQGWVFWVELSQTKRWVRFVVSRNLGGYTRLSRRSDLVDFFDYVVRADGPSH